MSSVFASFFINPMSSFFLFCSSHLRLHRAYHMSTRMCFLTICIIWEVSALSSWVSTFYCLSFYCFKMNSTETSRTDSHKFLCTHCRVGLLCPFRIYEWSEGPPRQLFIGVYDENAVNRLRLLCSSVHTHWYVQHNWVLQRSLKSWWNKLVLTDFFCSTE